MMKEKLRRLMALILAMAMSLSLVGANVWSAELEADADDTVAAQSEQEEHVHEDDEAPAVQEESADEELPAETESGEQQEESAQPEPQESGEEAAEAEAEPDAEPEQPEAEPGKKVILSGRREEYKPKGYKNMNPEEALDAYVQEELSAQDAPDGMPRTARENLSETSQKMYDVLAEQIAEVAEGNRANTEFSVSVASLDLNQTSWTADELEVPEELWFDDNGCISNEVCQALEQQIELDRYAVIDALLADEPFRLFWYDKNEGVYMTMPIYYSNDGTLGLDEEDSYVFQFTVSADYDDETVEDWYTVDTYLCAAVSTAAETAAGIVEQYASVSDYDKLNGYREKICELTDYNEGAVDENNDTPYGNPWQCIWVFDGDDDTTVVCEGYSKAFQHLCDNSEFTSSQIRCLSVTGLMTVDSDGGGHMWNVVRMDDGANYLVDVTNCDEGSIGAPDQLFLVGTPGDVYEGYTFTCGEDQVSYIYDQGDEDIIRTLGKDALTLSATNYDSAGDDDQNTNKCGENVTWSFDEDSATLTISGSGDMWDYYDDDEWPDWNDFRESIQTVVIDDGVTSIGAYAFAFCSELTTLYVSDTVTSIGVYAFQDCNQLSDVYMPDDWPEIDEDTAFLDTPWWNNQGGEEEVTYGEPTWKWSNDYSFATASFQPSDGSDPVVKNAKVTKATTEATCIDAGSDVYTATVSFDGKSYTDTKTVEIPARGHAWGAPTYQWNAGHTEVTAKRVCANDPQHVETETVAATAQVTRKATCTSMGLHTYTSNAFKKPAFLVQTLTLADIEKDSNSHAGGTVVKNQKAATCGAAGYTGDTYCRGCNRMLSSGKAIPATGRHSWNGGVVTKAASYTAAGVRTYTCTVCHAQNKVAIPKLVLPGTKLSKVTVKKLTATVTWSKNTRGSGYRLQYATDKKFKKGVKTIKVTNNKTVKATIKKLTKGKTYYFRICTTKGSAVSAWSGVKSVKAK